MNMLNNMCNISAVSGNEEKYIEFLKELISSYNAKIKTDNMNNLFVIFGEEINSETVILECGIDQPGIMICGIEKNGKVNFDAVGTINAVQLLNSFAEKDGEIIGIIRTDKKNTDNLKVSDLYLELNCDNTKADNYIAVGDFCSVSLNLFSDDKSGTLISDLISAKIPAYTVINVIEKLNSRNELNNKNLCIIFNTQKHLGARGLKTALNGIEGKCVISVGCSAADDNFKVKCGCGILVKDLGTVTSLTLRKKLQSLATENEIPYQINITDKNRFINSIAVCGKGYLCCGIDIPIAEMGNKLEKANLKDIQAAENLICEFITNN